MCAHIKLRTKERKKKYNPARELSVKTRKNHIQSAHPFIAVCYMISGWKSRQTQCAKSLIIQFLIKQKKQQLNIKHSSNQQCKKGNIATIRFFLLKSHQKFFSKKKTKQENLIEKEKHCVWRTVSFLLIKLKIQRQIRRYEKYPNIEWHRQSLNKLQGNCYILSIWWKTQPHPNHWSMLCISHFYSIRLIIFTFAKTNHTHTHTHPHLSRIQLPIISIKCTTSFLFFIFAIIIIVWSFWSEHLFDWMRFNDKNEPFKLWFCPF